MDLLIGYIAHKKRKTPGIPESGGQAIQQSPGSLVNGRAQSPLRLQSEESGGETHARRVRTEPLCCEAQFSLRTGNSGKPGANQDLDSAPRCFGAQEAAEAKGKELAPGSPPRAAECSEPRF